MDVRIPLGVGVSHITVDRDRAEVTDIAIGFYVRGLPVIDGAITPAQKSGNPYQMRNPTEFQLRKSDFNIWVTGSWRWGNTPGQGMARAELVYRRDAAIVAFWTGSNEPSNTRVILHLQPPLIAGAVPRIDEITGDLAEAFQIRT